MNDNNEKELECTVACRKSTFFFLTLLKRSRATLWGEQSTAFIRYSSRVNATTPSGLIPSEYKCYHLLVIDLAFPHLVLVSDKKQLS